MSENSGKIAAGGRHDLLGFGHDAGDQFEHADTGNGILRRGPQAEVVQPDDGLLPYIKITAADADAEAADLVTGQVAAGKLGLAVSGTVVKVENHGIRLHGPQGTGELDTAGGMVHHDRGAQSGRLLEGRIERGAGTTASSVLAVVLMLKMGLDGHRQSKLTT